VSAIDFGDFRNLRHVQLGGNARQDVLAVGGGWRQDVAVAPAIASTCSATFSARPSAK
jgi:ABC-type taurine transport system ATPase subunit